MFFCAEPACYTTSIAYSSSFFRFRSDLLAFFAHISDFKFWCLTPSLPNERPGHLDDFPLSNARRFYSSMGKPLDGKGLRNLIKQLFHSRLLDMRLVIANSALRASLAIYIPLINLVRSVITGKSQTEALLYWPSNSEFDTSRPRSEISL